MAPSHDSRPAADAPGQRPTRIGPAAGETVLRRFLCGDVMTGREIDQLLPHPCDPVLFEPWVTDARGYVALAERRDGVLDRESRAYGIRVRAGVTLAVSWPTGEPG